MFRRKKERVSTHDKDGKRARYFADDDRHDLKSLFEREKLSTAEDQGDHSIDKLKIILIMTPKILPSFH